MPQKSNEPPEAARSKAGNASNNTPIKPRRNADYSPDSARALMLHIRQNIFYTNQITLETAFHDIFLKNAPPLNRHEQKDLETSLGFTFDGLESEISHATSEKAMCKAIARLLSALTLLVEVNDNDRCLSLPKDQRWMTTVIATHTPLAETEHPGHKCDLGSFPATKDAIRQFVKSGDNPSFVPPWSSMGHVGEVKLRSLPTKDSEIEEKAQAILYMWSCSRNQVNRSGFLGFYACCDGLQFIWYGVSKVKISPNYKWNDFQALFSFVYALHRRENMLEDTRLVLHFDQNRLVSSVLPWHGKDYKLTTFSMDDGWRRKRFIAGGYSPDGEVVVVKLAWRRSGHRLKEAEVCERIHKDGLVAGVVSLLGDHNDSPRLYELLPNETESDTTYIRQMLVYDTIGESLSSCGSIKSFLIAMFDLVEILRFINTKKHLLHRDVSWSNIILNPRRIGTPKRLAKEQPESFAKFIDPLNEDTFQDRIVNGVMTQHLGTVALLDLELAADLDPTEGARDGIETMGTPMFIARDRSHYREVPAFDPWFWKRHKRFFETSPEKSRPDLWILFWEEAVKTLQIMQFSSILPIASRQELPLHDVESVFWVIVLFFIRASPCNAKEEKEETSKDGINRRTNAFRTLSNNHIGEDDGRIPLLQYSEENWRRALHPELHCFAPMLHVMASYFTNTWQYFEDAQGDNNVHGHEAMRRILWHAIKSMKADIPLRTEPVEVEMSFGVNYYTMNSGKGNKRKAESQDIDGKVDSTIPHAGLTSKKKRVEPSPLLESGPEIDESMTQLLMTIRDSHKGGKRWLQSTEVSYMGLDLCSVTTTGNT